MPSGERLFSAMNHALDNARPDRFEFLVSINDAVWFTFANIYGHNF